MEKIAPGLFFMALGIAYLLTRKRALAWNEARAWPFRWRPGRLWLEIASWVGIVVALAVGVILIGVGLAGR
jgi:hypothetical protein